MKPHLDPQKVAQIFDEWVLTLPEKEKERALNAVKNAAALPLMGETTAKELVINTLLFCDEKRVKTYSV